MLFCAALCAAAGFGGWKLGQQSAAQPDAPAAVTAAPSAPAAPPDSAIEASEADDGSLEDALLIETLQARIEELEQQNSELAMVALAHEEAEAEEEEEREERQQAREERWAQRMQGRIDERVMSYEHLGLDEKQDKALRDFLAWQMDRRRERWQKYREGEDTSEYEADPTLSDFMSELLGSDQYAEFETLETERRNGALELTAMRELQRMQEVLQLSEEQKDQVFQSVYQLADEQGGEASRWGMWIEGEDRLQAVQGILTPEQAEVYQKVLSQEGGGRGAGRGRGGPR